MSREAAGAAVRTLREARDWSLADLAAASGVSVMGLSYLERGARKPHKTTIQKVENGLGLPSGTYQRLAAARDPGAELAELLPTVRPAVPPSRASRAKDVDVLEAHADAHIESLTALVSRLPADTENDYETYIQSVIAQCVRAEMLAANSWRVAVQNGADSAERLMAQLRTLEQMRTGLLARLPGSLAARFDRACVRSELPESVIAALLGVGVDEMWDIRNRGAIPPDALARVRAFVDGDR